MSFRFEPQAIPEVILVRPTRHTDARGYFEETYRRSAFERAGIDVDFVQDNFARSARHVLRGLHYQIPPRAQAKLVSVAAGRIFDVAVDLRAGSATFGRWVGCELDSESRTLLWIPEGFAHGYVVLSETAEVMYKVTEEYAAQLDRGIRWDDPTIGIEWPVRDPIVSEKDRVQPTLEAAEKAFR
ncbi:MAG: dTDP-4-dehydrorhamnose 3,5-epimerase [Gemmatimonadales bacterium]